METPQQIGKYLIVGTIGRGAMGAVYKAQDPSIGRFVAIKTVQPALVAQSRADELVGADDASAVNARQFGLLVERLRLEARAAGNLRHPNIVTIFEVGEDAAIPYLVMDFVDGESLAEVIAKRAPLAPAEVLKILWQIASALDYAHERGVLHKDIKPANIIIDRTGQVQLLDFGIAALTKAYLTGDLGSDSSRVASPESVALGTPAYMSPEQLQNQPVTQHTDLFSLAIVAFELLTAQRPFPGSSFEEVVGSILRNRRVSLLDLAPSLPLALEAEFETALAPKPQHRFGSAQAMVDAFAKAVGVELVVRSAAVMTPQVEPREFEPPPIRNSQAESEWRDSGTARAGHARLSSGSAYSESARASAMGAAAVDAGGRRRSSSFEKQLFGSGAVDGAGGGMRNREGLSLSAIVLVLLFVGLTAIGIAMLVASPPTWLVAGTSYSGQSLEELESAVSIGEEELVPPVTEPAPNDRAVIQLTDRQVLGLVMNERAPEAIVKEAIDEGARRRLSGLTAALMVPLKHDAFAIRLRALDVLSSIGDRRVVPAVLEVLDDHDPLVRGYAARCLGVLGDRRALPYLHARSAAEPVPEVRESLKRAIERISGAAPQQ